MTIARLRPDAQPNAVISNLREVADWFRDVGINDLADDADRVADNAALRLNTNSHKSDRAVSTFCHCHPGRPMAGCPNPNCQ